MLRRENRQNTPLGPRPRRNDPRSAVIRQRHKWRPVFRAIVLGGRVSDLTPPNSANPIGQMRAG
jgi:hypothetical protein